MTRQETAQEITIRTPGIFTITGFKINFPSKEAGCCYWVELLKTNPRNGSVVPTPYAKPCIAQVLRRRHGAKSRFHGDSGDRERAIVEFT